MSKSFKALGLAVGALALTHLPAAAQTKVTNQGISADEIVIGTHQDLSGPIKFWGVPVSNGMPKPKANAAPERRLDRPDCNGMSQKDGQTEALCGQRIISFPSQ